MSIDPKTHKKTRHVLDHLRFNMKEVDLAKIKLEKPPELLSLDRIFEEEKKEPKKGSKKGGFFSFFKIRLPKIFTCKFTW